MSEPAGHCDFPLGRLSRITLGTVQLGLPYGSLELKQPPRAERTRALLDAAWASGVSALDKARAYGRAEDRIGDWLGRRRSQPSPMLINKLAALDRLVVAVDMRLWCAPHVRTRAAASASTGSTAILFIGRLILGAPASQKRGVRSSKRVQSAHLVLPPTVRNPLCQPH